MTPWYVTGCVRARAPDFVAESEADPPLHLNGSSHVTEHGMDVRENQEEIELAIARRIIELATDCSSMVRREVTALDLQIAFST